MDDLPTVHAYINLTRGRPFEGLMDQNKEPGKEAFMRPVQLIWMARQHGVIHVNESYAILERANN